MIEKSQGIVLQNYKYGDTSIISHIYTRKYGRRSFIFKGIRKQKSKQKFNLVQPLHLLELDFYYKEHKEILLVKEFNRAKILTDIPYNPLKTAQALVISEILSKCLQEEIQNEDLYLYLEHSIEYLDLREKNYSNFHLSFLLKFCKYLGIQPKVTTTESSKYFDLIEGKFVSEKPLHKQFSDEIHTNLLSRFFIENLKESSEIKINSKTRMKLLKIILNYYTIHNYKVDKLKSVDVLMDVFHT